MRDVIVSLIVIGSLPACFRRPLVGLLMFSLLAYMRLQDLAWGFARYQRWSFYVAIVAFAGYIASRNRKPVILELRTVLMILLAVMTGVGLFFANGRGEVEIPPYIEFVKIIAIALFTTAVVQTREHLRMLLWVIAMSFGFYGVKNGLGMILSGGRLTILQGPGGMLADNNDFALAMVMAIPLLWHLSTSERRPILRRTVIMMIPLTMITVMATQSRGAALSMAFMLSILVWRSRNRLTGILIGVFIVLAAVALAPKSYVERLESIKNYEDDGSAMGRIAAWKVAGRMIRANPVFGVGLDRFKQNYIAYEPAATPDMLEGKGTRVAHNSYLQIWAECGTPAFMIYITLLLLSMIDLWRLRWQAKRLYHASWILSYSTMLEASLASFILGSIFLNRAHFDLVYHYHAIVIVFGVIARREMLDEQKYPARRTAAFGGRLVQVRGAGFRAHRPGLRFGFRDTPLFRGRS